MENNGKWSSGKRTRHLNIRYFFLTDQIGKKYIVTKYYPTQEMVADYMTKPTQGKKFTKFRNFIMNL